MSAPPAVLNTSDRLRLFSSWMEWEEGAAAREGGGEGEGEGEGEGSGSSWSPPLGGDGASSSSCHFFFAFFGTVPCLPPLPPPPPLKGPNIIDAARALSHYRRVNEQVYSSVLVLSLIHRSEGGCGVARSADEGRRSGESDESAGRGARARARAS